MSTLIEVKDLKMYFPLGRASLFSRHKAFLRAVDGVSFKIPQHPYTVNLLAAIPRLGDLEARKRLEPIKGTVPGLFSRPSGCAFHPRCDSFMSDRCDAAFPELREVSENHAVACYLYTEDF